MKNYISIAKQVSFFGIVGLVTLGIDILVSASLYNIAHLPAYLASAAGFLSGFFFNFPINRRKVFKHSKYDRFTLHQQATMYLTLCIINLVSTSIIVDILVNKELMSIQYAKIAVTALIAIWNFLFFKFYIFSKTTRPVQ